MRRNIFLSGLIVFIIGIAVIMISPYLAAGVSGAKSISKSYTLDISPLSSRYIVLSLSPNDYVYVSGDISGGNNDIEFYITDPDGNYVRQRSRVYGSFSYGFTAYREGSYTLWFDNSFSIITSKTVNLELSVKPTGTYVSEASPIFTEIAFTLIFVGLSAMGVGAILRQQVKENLS